MTTHSQGAEAERQAESFLASQGFSTLARNFRAKTGEIDLIVTSGDLLVFVEVRMRRNPGYGSGADSVTITKQRKIINTAKLFLQRQKQIHWQAFRFDVISISDSIDWIPGAFTLD